MTENGNKPGVIIAEKSRFRGSGPILLLAVLFVVATFLSWYLTWFGRGLSDSEISNYLNDEAHPRHVQHALLQIQQRMEKGDSNVRQWYPRIVALAGNAETEFRLTVAWVMGSDNRSDEFHQALLKLVHDDEPIVRRNAALALLRFGDSGGHHELIAILEPYVVRARNDGVVASTLNEQSQLTRGTLLARIESNEGKTEEVRSPLPGQIGSINASNGTRVSAGDPLLTINSDDESIWEALRALSFVAEKADLALVERYLQPDAPFSSRIKEQAALTAKAIRQTADSNR